MKIAMVSMNAGPLACLGGVEGGGQSVVIDCLSRALSLDGHSVTISTQRDDPSLPGCLTTATGVHVDHVDGAAQRPYDATPLLLDGIAAFGARLAAEWRAAPPDVVHAHSWMSGMAAVAAARPLGIPVVQTFHGLARAKRGRIDAADSTALRAAQEAALVRAAARIVATSSAEVFALLSMGANPGAIKFIPCGVDLDLFAPGVPPAATPGVPFRVATLSRLVPDAGTGDVIEALRSVLGVVLTVAGGRCGAHDIDTDPDARALAAAAAAHGVANRVTFRGHVRRDDVPAFLRSADLVVCAPWHDSIGTVALEAMACGVPVVVSAVGGHVDAVADGICGMHVPPQSPRQIAYAIEALRADPSRRERFRRFGIERTTERYGWRRIASETLAVYASAASRPAELSRGRA